MYHPDICVLKKISVRLQPLGILIHVYIFDNPETFATVVYYILIGLLYLII